MGPKKVADVKGNKRMMLSMEMKMDIIKKYKTGMRLSVLAKEYGRNPSTVGTFLKQKEAIKAATPKGVTVSSSKSHRHDEMGRRLLVWITDQKMAGDTITEAIISHKACAIFGDLVLAQAEADAGEETSIQKLPEFKDFRGWFKNLRDAQEFILWCVLERLEARTQKRPELLLRCSTS
ncbi:putative CENPB DNA-binding domain-containing protein 1 [Palaemon carinicauda]|uniref:putative CENPB DNA-binding domain-containing protein 1 n=1 Tax=Palaemon carinicauda TaxID=392227 RepID=UPI0035B59BB6